MKLKTSSILIAVILAFAGSLAYAQNFKGRDNVKILIGKPESSIRAGETLQYSVEWLGIPVGSIVLRNEGMVNIDGHDCYHLTAASYPNSFIRKLYDVEYKIHSYWDVRLLVSRRFVKIRRMNKKLNYVVINFFPEKRKVVYKSWGNTDFVNFSNLRDAIVIEPTSEIPEKTQDLLSSFYYFRLSNIEKGGSYPVNIYYCEGNWPIQMKVEDTLVREMRKTGTFEAIDVLIASSLNEYIIGRHKFSVYLTADSRRIPIEFKVGTALGYIHGVIQELPK
jgi:hypothetical protein